MRSVDFIPGSEAPAELLHFMAGVASRFHGENVRVAVSSSPRLDIDLDASIEGATAMPLRDESVVMIRPSQRPASTVGLEGGVLVVRRIGESAEISLALALSPSTFPREVPRRLPAPRLLFYGGDEHDRRVRMTIRVLDELRARHVPFVAVVIGSYPSKLLRDTPGEAHRDLTAMEWARLIRSSSCIVEATEAREPPSPGVAAALAAGRPLVTFRSSVDAGGWPGAVHAESWSTEAFVEAIQVALELLPDPSPSPFETAISRVREVLDGD